MTDAAAKMANLFRELWSDAEEESRSLRNLLAGAQEEVCSLTCRSHFPAGHVHSEADHSDKCRAITDALNDAALDSTDRAVVSAVACGTCGGSGMIELRTPQPNGSKQERAE